MANPEPTEPVDRVRAGSNGRDRAPAPALDGAQLVPPGVDPKLEIEGQAEGVYNKPNKPNGPVTQSNSGPQPEPPPPGLPTEPVPAIQHIYYDASGKLDPARHPGAMFVYLAAIID